ncbi:hypothetical protein FB45DRAFT_344546 [Roridomyces roridus]|uniref:DUF1275 domain protein n=1 Tax=Roridomyces roridus TaxID=1738132 RepID=A0AAD7F906_9AGAR|nr:hypothetical protein FB45DRAFT_344546 [Roridomyces roridus]
MASDHDEQPLLLPKTHDGFSWREFLSQQVDPESSTAPLVAYCFVTGFIDAISFTAVFVWCGFQTGNVAQLALALARTIKTRTLLFSLTDRQALLSLLSFNIGAFLGRISDSPRLSKSSGPKTRTWLISGTLFQSLLTLAAGLCIQASGEESISHTRGQPAWTSRAAELGLAMMAMSLGLQGIMAKRLNTQFSTTVVLTAVWVELMVEPKLFWRSGGKGRDHKLLALGGLFVGAVVARLLVEEIGAPATLAVGAGVKLLVALGWMFVPEKGGNRAATTQPPATYGAIV